MRTDSTQVMRVLDRCLDTAEQIIRMQDPSPATGESDSNTSRRVAAAALRARVDPHMHNAISALLTEEHQTTSWTQWRRALDAARQCRPDDLTTFFATHSGGHESDPVNQMLRSCMAASRAGGQPNSETAVSLAEMILGIIMLEESSFGTKHCSFCRNTVAHVDIASTLIRLHNLEVHKKVSQPRKPR